MLRYEIVLPVLNEENRLPVGIQKLLSFMRTNARCDWHITIVDNGSTDSTSDIIAQIQKSNTEVSSIYLDSPGVGNALAVAWNKSDADIVGYMDIDMSTDLFTMFEVFNYFESNIGVFNASRNKPESEIFGRSFKRTITSKVLSFIFDKSFNINVSDCMCGFKFLSRRVFLDIQSHGIRNKGWFFCAEILVLASVFGYKIYEMPVRWVDSPDDSKVKIFRLTKYYLQEILILRKTIKTKKNC